MHFVCNIIDPFFGQIITCHKKWIIYNNCKQYAWSLWVPQTLPKAKFASAKVIVTVWWSTISAEIYRNQLADIHSSLQKKMLALVNWRGQILFRDNARPLVARLIMQKLTYLDFTSSSIFSKPFAYRLLFWALKHIFKW